jgi:hypothetical protein
MKFTRTAVVLLSSLFAGIALGQGERFNVYGNYSYIQFNPSVTGFQSRAYNGGGGGAQLNFGKFFGIKGDFQGYGSTQWTVVYPTAVTTPAGTIPAGTYKSNANMFTYLFGPVVRVPVGRVVPYGEVLFGGSNTNGYASLSDSVAAAGGTVHGSGTQHPFTMAIGGGLDVSVNKHIALRLAELDYLLTRYTNPFTNTNNQNSFRYQAGVVFKFGGER